MIVTDKKYSIDDKLKSKLDLMIKRIKGADDAIVIIDGDEGQGKTELAFGICYYVSHKTKRKYDIDNVFFDLDSLINYAKSTKDKIIHFDEAALGLLRTQWQKGIQQKFLQLVMIARKKRHFIVLCIPKFHRLPPYVVEDRSIAMLHVYSHKNIHKGRFCYYKKSGLQKLFKDYQKKKTKSYRKFFAFRGRFVIASDKVFTKEQVDQYDKKKDDAIINLGVEKNDPNNKQKNWLAQRNKLIVFIKDNMKISYNDIAREFRDLGEGALSPTGVQKIYLENR